MLRKSNHLLFPRKPQSQSSDHFVVMNLGLWERDWEETGKGRERNIGEKLNVSLLSWFVDVPSLDV